MRRLLRVDPSAVIGLVTTALTVGIAFGLGINAAQVAAIAGVIGAAFVLLRSFVSSPATLATVASEAAAQTAAQLTAKTVGAAGEVTETGVNVVAGAVNGVLNEVGGLAGKLTGAKE